MDVFFIPVRRLVWTVDAYAVSRTFSVTLFVNGLCSVDDVAPTFRWRWTTDAMLACVSTAPTISAGPSPFAV